MTTRRYQFLDRHRPEVYAALKADVAKRGIQIPIDVDQDGNVIDGHHRAQIAAELGIDCPRRVLTFASEAERIEHAVKMNLARRHLDPIAWGRAFARLLEVRGVHAGQGARNDRTSATVAEVAAEVGVPERTARYRMGLLSLPEPLRASIQAGEIGAKEATRIVRQQAKQDRKAGLAAAIRSEPAPLPTGPFRVIVADPPWPYEKRPDDLTHRARLPYPEMTLDAIRALPVADLAADDAILWLWTTNAHLEEAYTVVRAWGFTPKTMLTWGKNRMGTGDWLRGQAEHCLMAVRGKPTVLLTNQTTLLTAPVGAHSAKPDEFYALVEALCPGSKVDLFARQARPGWAVWGAEAVAA